jgi:hypothetical protein
MVDMRDLAGVIEYAVLCEAAKFAEARTHFDTNHCTAK